MKNFRRAAWCAALLLIAAAGPAASQTHSRMKQGTRNSSAMSPQEQRSVCMNQRSRSVENCMKEMAAARQAAQRGQLTRGNSEETYAKNRLARCDALPAADREECVARMTTPTATSGSVAGGGILYESKEIVPAGTPGSQVIPGSAVVPGAVIVPRRALRP